MNLFKTRLKTLRSEGKKTQQELAESLNISKQTISNYESGFREPSIDILCEISTHFKVSIDYLLGRSEFKGYGQEYDFRRKLAPDLCDDLNEQYKIFNSSPLLRELNSLLVSIDEKYSLITTDILAGNKKFSTFALQALDHLLNSVAYIGEILKEDVYDDDLGSYINFLNKLKETALFPSDFGHIQADQTQVKACTRYFNEFISLYVCSLIDSDKTKPDTEV